MLLIVLLLVSDGNAGRKKKKKAPAPTPPAVEASVPFVFGWSPGDAAAFSRVRTVVVGEKSLTTIESGTLTVSAADNPNAMVVSTRDFSRNTDSLGFTSLEQSMFKALDGLPAPAFLVDDEGYYQGLADLNTLNRAIFSAGDTLRANVPADQKAALEDLIFQQLNPMRLSERPRGDWERFPGGFLGRVVPPEGAPMEMTTQGQTVVGTLPLQVTLRHLGETPCTDEGQGTCVRLRLSLAVDPDAPQLTELAEKGGRFENTVRAEWTVDPANLKPYAETYEERTVAVIPGQPNVDRTESQRTRYTWQ